MTPTTSHSVCLCILATAIPQTFLCKGIHSYGHTGKTTWNVSVMQHYMYLWQIENVEGTCLDGEGGRSNVPVGVGNSIQWLGRKCACTIVDYGVVIVQWLHCTSWSVKTAFFELLASAIAVINILWSKILSQYRIECCVKQSIPSCCNYTKEWNNDPIHDEQWLYRITNDHTL